MSVRRIRRVLSMVRRRKMKRRRRRSMRHLGPRPPNR
jgi:hypothetical protein